MGSLAHWSGLKTTMLEVARGDEAGEVRPLVTVAMPIYNAGQYLRLAVLSIVEQTFTDWELLIIDDGSTDDALKSIEDINDARIRILRDGENKGLAARLNECIDMARGQYLARMDQDDVSYPERFSRQIMALQHDSLLDLVASRAITIDENSQLTGMFPSAITHDEICNRPWKGFYFPHPTWMGTIEWFRKYRYTEPGPYFCEDQDLLLRSYQNSRFAVLEEIQFAYRIRHAVNWKKLARTRRSVLLCQLRQFKCCNQWHFFFLAALVFLARIIRDFFKKLGGGYLHTDCVNLDKAVASSWSKILGVLVSKTKKL